MTEFKIVVKCATDLEPLIGQEVDIKPSGTLDWLIPGLVVRDLGQRWRVGFVDCRDHTVKAFLPGDTLTPRGVTS